MFSAHPRLLIALALLATGCEGDKGPAVVEECGLEAAPAATPVAGDANGDGHMDVSDGVYLSRHLFDAGPAVACETAVDLPPTGTLDATDTFALLYELGPRSYDVQNNVDVSACAAATRTATPACGGAPVLAVSAPETVTGAAGAATSLEATVTLSSATLAVEAWSFTLQASGCALSAGSTAGTKAADKADDPPGIRDGGFIWQDLGDGSSAGVLTVLDWRTAAALTPSEDPVALHTFTVSATPGAACAPCTLSLVSGAAGVGVEAVLSGGGGYRYTPTLGSATVQVCPG